MNERDRSEVARPRDQYSSQPFRDMTQAPAMRTFADLVEVLPVKKAVDSQIANLTDQWPADTALNLLNRIRKDLSAEVDRLDGMIAYFEGEEAA